MPLARPPKADRRGRFGREVPVPSAYATKTRRPLVPADLAAVALAIVSTKDPEHFRTTPGGYFHGMVQKAKTGELHLERSVWALRRAAEPTQAPRSG
jgi:hypothetical protein